MHLRETKEGIRIYDPADFDGMRKAGRLAAEILDAVGPLVKAGATTHALDAAVEKMVDDAGALSATIGYKGYKHASCISVNHVVCHGIPGSEIPKSKYEKVARKNDILKDGDILNVDVTVIVDGWFGDTSRMYTVGPQKKFAERLVQVTHDSLMEGINTVKPGNTFGDIGYAIQKYAEARKMAVVRDFCGHGIGRVFHSPPNVLHYGRAGSGATLEEGMIFTIEPMLNLGRPETKVLSDDWTAITVDKTLSAQFEHSIAVTSDGFEIFTQSPKDIYFPS
ncbi:type I methionyl aminopeptidase [Halocynthiibacter namhaensis]|uniref:type I methionyl aminopeptidase n=1 Tax=Halocynthiibacter namhaensis TaxID=1290553 RepID=UPI0009DE0B87|nr:type I methionyl aminopeptidase [Halocynthiibacter namhaensis]